MDVTEVILGMGARLVQQAASGGRVANRYVQAALGVLTHSGRWSAVEMSGVVCATRIRTPLDEVIACEEGAIGGCVSCRAPVCIDHAFISVNDGNAICFSCVAAAQGAGAVPQPAQESFAGPACSCQNPWQADESCLLHGSVARTQTRKRMLGVLGLDGDPSWSEVQTRYRKMAKLFHPDKGQNSNDRMAKINEAFAWLKENKEAA